MRLIITENQKHLIRFENAQIEVFSLNPIQPQFRCEGQILGFSLDSSLMLVRNQRYQVYDLAQGNTFNIQEANRADFAPEVLLDIRKHKPGLSVEIFDVINDTVLHELTLPEEKGVNKRLEGTGKIIASPYAMVLVLRDGDLAIERHIFDLSTGKHQITIERGIDHYQAKHNRLFLRQFNGAILLEFNEQVRLTSVIPWRFKNRLPRFWPVSAIGSFPSNRNLLAFAREKTVYFVDILSPQESPEDSEQISDYGTSISSEKYVYNYVSALCADDSGRYLYISHKNDDIRIFDTQAKEFTVHYRMQNSMKIPKATRRV